VVTRGCEVDSAGCKVEYMVRGETLMNRVGGMGRCRRSLDPCSLVWGSRLSTARPV